MLEFEESAIKIKGERSDLIVVCRCKQRYLVEKSSRDRARNGYPIKLEMARASEVAKRWRERVGKSSRDRVGKSSHRARSVHGIATRKSLCNQILNELAQVITLKKRARRWSCKSQKGITSYLSKKKRSNYRFLQVSYDMVCQASDVIDVEEIQ